MTDPALLAVLERIAVALEGQYELSQAMSVMFKHSASIAEENVRYNKQMAGVVQEMHDEEKADALIESLGLDGET